MDIHKYSHFGDNTQQPPRELVLGELVLFIICQKKAREFGIKVWLLYEALPEHCLQYQIYTDKPRKESQNMELAIEICLIF